MQKRTIRGAGVPLLGFGTMRLPTMEDGSIDYETGKAMADTALAAGVNYFDTAYFYHGGESEHFVGRALAGVPRADYILADKMPLNSLESAQQVDQIFQHQLEKTGAGYFDQYLLHAVNGENFKKAQALGVIPYLEDKLARGVIRRLGFSFHDGAEVLRRVLAVRRWDFVQLQLNYYDWAVNDASELHRAACEAEVPIVVMEPVRGGFLARLPAEIAGPLLAAVPGKSLAGAALCWAASLPGVATVLSGMSSPLQMEENIRTLSDFTCLTEAEQAAIALAAKQLAEYKSIPCTACSYCMPCPAGVNIPGVLHVMNNYKLMNNVFEARSLAAKLGQDAGPGSCVACGACAARCPQQLAIPRLMDEAVELYGKFMRP